MQKLSKSLLNQCYKELFCGETVLKKICTKSENTDFSRSLTVQNAEVLVLQVIHIVINIINILSRSVNRFLSQLCSG